MTWSIIARDRDSGCFGIIVASRFFAAGALVPYGRAGVGAIATQALVNSFYGAEGLALLQQGRSAPDVVAALVAADEGRNQRQVHAIDAQGRIGAHTGARCSGWCGHVAGEDVSVAGNILAGPEVVAESAAAYARESGLSLPRRLLAAMHAGEAAGGDRRGKQSAALVIYGEEDWPDLDLRVDDHPDPLAELQRLERVSHDVFVPIRRFLPRRGDRVGETDRGVIEAEIAKFAATASSSKASSS